MPKSNKVMFGLKNVHYAPFTTQVVNGHTIYNYGTPVAFSGAVSFAFDPQGDMIIFYADDGTYWVGDQNAGYEGPFVAARVPDAFRRDIMGEQVDVDGSLIENAQISPQPFALLFEMDGDAKAERCVLYNCTVRRGQINPETRTQSTQPQTKSLTLRASARADGVVKKQSGVNTSGAAYAAWYTAVPEATPDSASLTALTIGSLSLTPTFAAGVRSYTATTSNASDTITATPKTGATAVIQVNGTIVSSGSAVTWTSGANNVTVTVTDENGIAVVYAVTVTYTPGD